MTQVIEFFLKFHWCQFIKVHPNLHRIPYISSEKLKSNEFLEPTEMNVATPMVVLSNKYIIMASFNINFSFAMLSIISVLQLFFVIRNEMQHLKFEHVNLQSFKS